ncbi:hypothetical protein G6O67_007883 [Ophiocordyceps sinensis]|uniref:Extracellular protein n=2 Tax=Ophiocordyceps sinensis TaxID=72228 RepID=A0A8H4LSS8_9HYPO|nr:hypothetical protein OCS_02460 [Ophiocordyceps sinensis CO18]KAF4504432.1 hypothetical protein G6O67_007883 [Ophiocordyceps sinensis]
MKSNGMLVTALVGLASLAQAHMEMKDPAPLRSKFNKFTTNQDYDIKSPLDSKGSNFPCRGSLGLVGKPQGQSVAEWTAGKTQSMTIVGGAAHGGGSCQASLSHDRGKTWKVVHSITGGCPTQGESTFPFTLPRDTPAGEAIFAWTWFNKVGNREMYMNCAVITVKPACVSSQVPGKFRRNTPAFSDRPDMFVANVNNGCRTTEGTDVEFPDPGAEVDLKSRKTSKPVGECAS